MLGQRARRSRHHDLRRPRRTSCTGSPTADRAGTTYGKVTVILEAQHRSDFTRRSTLRNAPFASKKRSMIVGSVLRCGLPEKCPNNRGVGGWVLMAWVSESAWSSHEHNSCSKKCDLSHRISMRSWLAECFFLILQLSGSVSSKLGK